MRSFEIQIGNRKALVELDNRDNNNFRFIIDGKQVEANIIMVERGVYSVLLDGTSYNVELIDSDDPKKYQVNTYFNAYDAEVIDAESRYKKSRKTEDSLQDDIISSPMPGKVVKLPFKKGDEVKAGETVVIVSAMKMESEYKVKKDRKIKDIKVKEGDTIKADQPLIILE